ncbi:MAG TPA: flagellar filament capping protein FliD, partial [Polyangia bacterium]|nr:flagellar filament capping protein FliD [Polyangia bacterium]
MSATTSVSGLVSGLNTADLIDQIMAAERKSVTLLETRQAKASALRNVFQTLNSKLLALETSAKALTAASAFRGRTVSVSDTAVLDVAVASGATAGTYEVTVDSLAAAHRIASQGFADTASTTLGTGEIQIQVGDGETVTITVDSSNNTLEGLRSAINASGAGVTAMIINDGSAAVPYRLVLTAEETGAANTISVTSNIASGTQEVPSWIDPVVADPGNGYSGTATSSGTYTGSGDKTYAIQITRSGDLSRAEYRVSEDGGVTWGSVLAFGGNGTVSVYDDVHGTDLGVQVTFDNVAFSNNDSFTVDAHAAYSYDTGIPALGFDGPEISDAVADAGNAYSGAAATSGTYTGTSNRSYLVEIVQGGSLAEATYRVSEDGGLTWGSTLSLAGGTIGVYDGVHGSDLGVAAAFEEGTFAAGDRFTIDAFVPTVQEAADARLTIGSGAGAITVASASNTVEDVLPGLTLNLLKADPESPVSIRVENDVEGIQAKIQEFVDSYNSVIDYLRAQTRYDATSGQANLLLGNASAMKVQNDLRSAMLGTVAGLAGGSDGL